MNSNPDELELVAEALKAIFGELAAFERRLSELDGLIFGHKYIPGLRSGAENTAAASWDAIAETHAAAAAWHQRAAAAIEAISPGFVASTTPEPTRELRLLSGGRAADATAQHASAGDPPRSDAPIPPQAPRDRDASR